MSTLYDIPLKKIDGTPATLAEFAGKVLLIVNTASLCGLTPQYEGLQKLYDTYKHSGFEVLGFPANNFINQEPGTNQEIAKFCATSFSVNFPLFEKISVAGEDQHLLYELLTNAQPVAQVADPKFREGIESYGTKFPPPVILWNFEKFLVDRHGQVVGRFSPEMLPTDPRITASIEALLPPL